MTTARWLRLLGVTTLLIVLYAVVPVDSDPVGGLVLRTVLAVAVFSALAAAVVGQLRLVVADPEHHLDGLVLAIALVWILFSLTFYVISRHQQNQVVGLQTRVDALYFTASTILTIGYGDIHAVGQTARILVLLQMGFDVVFVTAAARVVGGRVRRRAAARARLTEAPGDRLDDGLDDGLDDELSDGPGAASGR